MSGEMVAGGVATPAPRGRAHAANWYALILLSAIDMFAYVDRSALAILMQPIKTPLNLRDQQLGLLSGLAFALFYSTLGVPHARLADPARHGARTLFDRRRKRPLTPTFGVESLRYGMLISVAIVIWPSFTSGRQRAQRRSGERAKTHFEVASFSGRVSLMARRR
jgi:hypothetical protein